MSAESSHRAKLIVCFATVYLVWGSTYLGIKVAGDTIPAFFAVSSRFLLAGALLAGWVAWRQGRGARQSPARAATPDTP